MYSEHKNFVSCHQKRKRDGACSNSKDFKGWFTEMVSKKLQEGEVISGHVKWLSRGPSYVAKKYTGYYVNGYRFYTMKRDASSVSQNSGVTLTALTSSFSSSKDDNPIEGDVKYYGSIQEIIKISYYAHISVVLFRCVLYPSQVDGDLTLVNKNRNIREGEPLF
ncbi:Calcium-transporting ATPase 2 [Bienertia sinuspersici]